MIAWVRQRTDLLDRARCYAELLAAHRTRRPVLVFSDAKTGTKSLAAAVETTGRPVIHCHKLTPYRGGSARSFARSRFPRHERPVAAWRGEYGRFLLRVDRRPQRWHVVCGVRDPMARMVSSLFEVGEQLGWLDPHQPGAELEPIIGHLAEMVDFEQSGPNWFDRELRAATGIDVLATPFDRDRGWQLYENTRFSLVLVRFEDLPVVGSRALQALLHLDAPPALPARNVAADKSYADLYGRFRAEAVIPARLLDAMYGSRIARHFYSDTELSEQRGRWAPQP